MVGSVDGWMEVTVDGRVPDGAPWSAATTATPGPVGPDTLWHSVGHPGRLTRLGWRPKFTLAETLADQYRSRL